MNGPKEFDIVVIGSGPGGQKAAIQGAKAGRRVALVERERRVGGACVHQGTIPSKTLRETALAMIQLRRRAAAFNVSLHQNLEVSVLMERLSRVLAAHTKSITDDFQRNQIELIHGRARFASPELVEVTAVNGHRSQLKAKTIVIATGSRPRCPVNIPVDHEHILDSDSILSMIYVPRSLIVLGGGVIASEYASIFSLLGTQVTMIDKAPRPLTFLDSELTERFVNHFERYGGRYLGGQGIKSVRWDGLAQVVTELESGEVFQSDKLLVALGRTANIEGLGLDLAGVKVGPRGNILADAHYQTGVPGVYAVGDVIGPPALATSSLEQGRRAICHALGLAPGNPFELVPIGIYAVPEMACVGLTEEQARQKHGPISVGRARFEETARGLIAGMEDGLVKLIADGNGRKLLGVHIVGDGATDLIHVGEMALLNGNEVEIFLENLLNFPTLGEAYRIAALNLINGVRERKAKLAEAQFGDHPQPALSSLSDTAQPAATCNPTASPALASTKA
jgi:NAD(P) transhydrogenase